MEPNTNPMPEAPAPAPEQPIAEQPAVAPEPVAAAPIAEPAPVANQAPVMAAAPADGKKSNTGLIIGIICAAVILLGAIITTVVLIAVNSNGNNGNSANIDTSQQESSRDEAKTANVIGIKIGSKSIELKKNSFADTLKSIVNAGFSLEYQDSNYDYHAISSSGLDDYLAMENDANHSIYLRSGGSYTDDYELKLTGNSVYDLEKETVKNSERALGDFIYEGKPGEQISILNQTITLDKTTTDDLKKMFKGLEVDEEWGSCYYRLGETQISFSMTTSDTVGRFGVYF